MFSFFSGETFDPAEGCGLLSRNRPLDILRSFFPTADVDLKNRIDELDRQFMVLMKEYWPDTDFDSILIFFKAFDPDRKLSQNHNKKIENRIEYNYQNNLKEKYEKNNDNDEDDEENDKSSVLNKEEKKKMMEIEDPLKYLGSYMFNNKSKLSDLFQVADALIQNYHNNQNLSIDEGTLLTESSRNVPDVWKNSLYYTISRTLVDLNEEINTDDDRVRAQTVQDLTNSVRYNFKL